MQVILQNATKSREDHVPTTIKDQQEMFAQAMADGCTAVEAAGKAGYRDRWLKRSEDRVGIPVIAARIARLKAERARHLADVGPVITLLMDQAEAAGLLGSAAGFTAARGLLIEAARLKAAAPPPPTSAGPPLEREMTEEEWLAEFGPKPGA